MLSHKNFYIILLQKLKKLSGATSEHLLCLTRDRAVARGLPMDLTLHLEPGMTFTRGKGGFTCPW